MTRSQEYESRTEAMLLPFLTQNGLELFDVEYVKEGQEMYLRAYIDKPGGVNIDDCETVSRFLSDELDRQDFIPDAYILEVSSPGLGRQLKKEKDFEKSVGKDVDVKLFRAVDKVKEFTGVLKGFSDDTVIIGFEDAPDMEIERKNIALIRLSIDF